MKNLKPLTIEMLAKRRRALGYKQQDVADLLGKSVRTVSSWETGEAVPSLSPRGWVTFQRIYGLSLEDIADVLEPIAA